jgi:hypothetical protein
MAKADDAKVNDPRSIQIHPIKNPISGLVNALTLPI